MRDFIVGIVGLFIGFLFILLSLDMPILIARGYPGPSFFPIILSITAIADGSLMLIKYFRKRVVSGSIISTNKTVTLRNPYLKNAVIFLIIITTYITSMPYLGFLLTSFIFLYIAQVIYGVSPIKALGIASGTTLFVYVLFIIVLKVVVPEPILGPIVYR